jgi:methylated-DNA-[protein]-cysteine S-methyltransferase
MQSPYLTYYSSPIGLIEISGTDQAISTVQFVEIKDRLESEQLPAVLTDCIHQLKEYFGGSRKQFEVAINLQGTEFQRQVWQELTTIAYGRTTTYMALARKFNNPNAVRAIGNSNSKNHLCLLLPCHRVVGSDGKLVGYAGGLWRKQWLLEHEQKHSGNYQLRLF